MVLYGVLVVALINVLVGLAFALAAKDRIRADGAFARPALALVGMHAGAIVAPIALYFYTAHAAWAWMYWANPHHIARVAGLPLMVGHAALVFLGWFTGAMLLRRKAVAAATYLAGVLTLGAAGAVYWFWPRLATAADFEGYKLGAGTSLFDVVLGWALAVAVLALLVSALYVFVELMRDSRRIRAR